MFGEKPLSINHKKIYRATKTDYDQLAAFFNQNPRIHRHLDWFTPLEWLGKQPFLFEKTDNQIQAVLCAAPENQESAWIRVFGVNKTQKISPVWKKLLNATIQDLQLRKVGLLATLLLHPWFQSLLEESSFIHKQNIVVLEWQGKLPDCSQINKSLEIRTMQFTDLPKIEKIDRLAFPSLWQNSLSELTKAFNQTGISTVAVRDGEILGYQISTTMTIYGHLARLAVHPDCQRERIAYTLVYDLLKRFDQRGFWRITVNTQSDNQASLRLYDQFGFKRTNEEIPVYSRII